MHIAQPSLKWAATATAGESAGDRASFRGCPEAVMGITDHGRFSLALGE